MDLKLKRPNVPDGYRVIWPLALLFAVLLLLFPRNAKFSYDYRKGSQWHHENLVAQFDFPILKTEEQLREERSRTNTSTVPYYRFRQDVVDNMVKGASEADLGGYPSLLPVVLASLEGIYETGVVPDEGVKLDKGEKDVSGAVMYVQKDKRAVKKPVTTLLVFIMLIAMGIYCTLQLPMDMYPNMELPYMLIMTSYPNAGPEEVEQSAKIDGATEFQLFWKIVLPLVAPGIAAISMLSFMYAWNEYTYSVIFIQKSSSYTIPISLALLNTEDNLTQFGLVAAGGVISVIPITLFVIFAQQYLIAGLSSGAVKE